MPRLLETKNGNTRRKDWCRKLDSPNSPQDGETRGHIEGISNKHHGREDEEIIKTSNIAIVVCKPTDLTGPMTPGHEPGGGVTGPGLDIGQARHKANACARGAGNLIL